MKEKLRLPLRKPAVIALLIAELLVIGFALAAALRPAAAYTSLPPTSGRASPRSQKLVMTRMAASVLPK